MTVIRPRTNKHWCPCGVCALDRSLHEQAFAELERYGYITVEHLGPDKMVEVRCGRLCWHELGFSFPSELLYAKVALAVEAGRHREIEGMGDKMAHFTWSYSSKLGHVLP